MCPYMDYLPWATIDTTLLIKQAEDSGEPDAQSLSQAFTKPLGLPDGKNIDSYGTVR